ncbi:prepilin-type N-terminal cleavage/methylation domain-containing protein [Marinobacterium weihaiense]|uniref:prepilin-type N-terminal cleavage/methylation domain-containing protein n=1 Tax=Marinobacterium weihaiense TaxID=2851016 RepID=UPI002738C149
MQRHKGFTLIEIMIVIAIIGILLSIALPAYSRYSIRSANGACLSEARGQVAAVMDAISQNDPTPTFKLSSCARITVAADRKSLTAFPVKPGDKGVVCDLDAREIGVRVTSPRRLGSE